MKQFDTLTVGFIGAGNMAEAIVRGLTERKVFTPSRIVVSDPSADRCRLFSDTFGVNVLADNQTVISKADVVVLAVKPQVMSSVLSPVKTSFRADQLVISIAAGILTGTLDAGCGGKPAIVRIMPNTPALIGKGVSAICAGPRANNTHMDIADKIFSAVGSTIRIDEKAMDVVTALSGSGPAYVFYWMEAMLKAATESGFDRETARRLVYQTFIGASALADASPDSPEILRARVTSKGGTTEAAIKTMEEAAVASSIMKAVGAAARRSQELSKS
jgi:pyrroline-5-carboxylate reductase